MQHYLQNTSPKTGIVFASDYISAERGWRGGNNIKKSCKTEIHGFSPSIWRQTTAGLPPVQTEQSALSISEIH